LNVTVYLFIVAQGIAFGYLLSKARVKPWPAAALMALNIACVVALRFFPYTTA
jgi:hypothetical protein